MNLKDLELKAADKINRQEAATAVKGQDITKINDEEAARFYVLRLELDEDVEVFLSGSKPLIPLQASLIKGFDDLIKARNSDWNTKQFWQWARSFENGFSEFIIGAKGEFLETIKSKKPWGIEPQARPQIVEIKKAETTNKSKSKSESKPKSSIFYKTILFYPDRSKPEYKLFTGSYKEIVNLIISWWNQKSNEITQSDRNSDVKMLSKHPKVYLYFEEDRPKNGKRPKEGEVSFRLMNKSDNNISIADLKKIGNKIKEIFGKSNGYLWEKGQRYANYNHWELGYKFQNLTPSAAEGEKFIRDLLSIQGHEFDKARMTYSQNQAEAKAFPEKPGVKRVLNENVDLPVRRPNCKVRFKYASIEIGALKQRIVVASRDRNNPVDFRLRG